MTLEEQYYRFKNNLVTNIKNAGLLLEKEMHRIVAIDTGALDQSISTSSVRYSTEGVYVDVGSENIEYAKKVEYGEGRPYNYHRYGVIVYSGVGQHWLTRSLENMKSGILSILKSTAA